VQQIFTISEPYRGSGRPRMRIDGVAAVTRANMAQGRPSGANGVGFSRLSFPLELSGHSLRSSTQSFSLLESLPLDKVLREHTIMSSADLQEPAPHPATSRGTGIPPCINPCPAPTTSPGPRPGRSLLKSTFLPGCRRRTRSTSSTSHGAAVMPSFHERPDATCGSHPLLSRALKLHSAPRFANV